MPSGKNWKSYSFAALFLAVLFLSVPLYAQRQESRPYWFTLEQGKLYFRGGEYGRALLSFEDARDQRKAMYTRMEGNLIELLSIPEVRRMGDSLDLIEAYIAERHHINAADALTELYYRYPKTSLRGSAAAALEQLGRLKVYPEAEYWIGETYRVEGELGIALRQYQKAHDQKEFLQSQEFDRDILYKIADIYRIRQDYNEMEKRLLEILEGDALWSSSSSFVRNAMQRTLENDGVDRFLTLYRHNNAAMEEAHRRLGFFYYASGRYPRAAEHLLFAFLIQNTILIDQLTARQYDFTFTSIEAVMGEVLKKEAPHRELVAYTGAIEYFKTTYYLSAALYGNGKLLPARELWRFLSRQNEAGQWSRRAAAQLQSPYIEPAQEMP